MIRRLSDNVVLFWLLLSLPGLWLLVQRLVLGGKAPFVPLSGEIAAWLLIATLMVTPLKLIFGPLPWMQKRRRHLGVASFGYSLLHLFFWLLNANIGVLLRSFVRIEILTGWIAFAVMVLLALTSNDAAVRAMGTGLKRLQKWVYAAAILTLLHWVMTSKNLTEIVIWCAPLAALSAWRMLRWQRRARNV